MILTFHRLLKLVRNTDSTAQYTTHGVIRIPIWDGRTVVGTPHDCREDEVDVSDEADIHSGIDPWTPFLSKLLTDEVKFITTTGDIGNQTTLQWSIEDPPT